MKKKRVLIAIAIIISFIFILNGCQSDNKQATKIQKILEKSAVFENDFATTQTKLFETRENAQLLYNDLISLDINDKEVINQKIDEANTYIEKQQKLLEAAEKNFHKAYNKVLTIEKNIKKIKNEDKRNQALKLLTIMNERKKLLNTFFELYNENLDSQNSFYNSLGENIFRIENLDEPINEINKRSQEMEQIIEQFNQYTQNYIEEQGEFYN
ncbi:YkyA family protein [Bacillus sp. 1P02SD]|uniref:YkyA family protein n=1 Tax=Bacillus sp. 1P02SD TaxID=3132264 RepID=UPI0039A38D8F